MEGFMIILIAIVVLIIVAIVKKKNKKNIEIVKSKSELYKAILLLNNQYKFHAISSNVINFSIALKSKRSLENFDMYQSSLQEISDNKTQYITMFNHLDENLKDYNEYVQKYKKLKKLTSEAEFSKFEGLKIKYKTFVKIEEKLYDSTMKSRPVTEVMFKIHATYTSPSGRNHYWRDASYNYNQLKQMLSYIQEQEKIVQFQRQVKEQLLQEKRTKEKRLRELDKLESQLAEKEKEINKREKEFLEATKGHIYTGKKSAIKNESAEITDNMSLTQKLKILKEKYDNGEISYEEYQQMRKGLM